MVQSSGSGPNAGRDAVEAFGAALDAAVSRVDAVVRDEDSGQVGITPRPEMPVFGEHTPEPSVLPPSLQHLEDERLDLALRPPPPLMQVSSTQSSQGPGLGTWLVLVVALAVLPGAAYFVLA